MALCGTRVATLFFRIIPISTNLSIRYSYPIPTLGRDGALETLQPALLEKGIYSRGRFGAWRYEIGNMDHSVLMGVEAVNHILAGEPELVFQSA